MDNKMLKDVLKEARTASGLKQSEVAEQMGVTPQTYLKWENGRSEPKITQVGNLSKILNVSVSEICQGQTFRNEADPLIFMRKIAVLKNVLDEVTFTSILAEYINDQNGFIERLETELRANEEAIERAEKEIKQREQMLADHEAKQEELAWLVIEEDEKRKEMEWLSSNNKEQ